MNPTIEKAKVSSKTAKKPLATIEDSERQAFDDLCSALDAVAAEDAKLAEEIKAFRDTGTQQEAVAAGDFVALRKCAEHEAWGAQTEKLHEALHSNLQNRRAWLWRNVGIPIVRPILERALAEARKRFQKMEADELREAEATGESPVISSAGREFLRKRINSLRVNLGDLEKRISHKKCAREFLAGHLIATE